MSVVLPYLLIQTPDHHTALCETGAIIPISHVRNSFRWCRQGENSVKGDTWHGSQGSLPGRGSRPLRREHVGGWEASGKREAGGTGVD